MTTRLDIPPPEPGKSQLETGYDTSGNDPSTFFIPSCGIEDVDVAVHTLFDKKIPFRAYQGLTGHQKEINLKKPFVIFATGERFALAKRLKPFRDTRTGALILPAISIRRTGLEQKSSDVFPGELTIKRRLDASDRDYQSLINRFLLPNSPSTPSSLRGNVGEDSNAPSIKEGMLLDNRPRNHVYEIISIPFPQFFTATYEVVFWSSYTQHMNYLIQTFLISQIAPGKGFRLESDKGYWFNALVEDGITSQENADDITDAERLIKHSFNISVRGYILATNEPGQRVPFKRYLSSVNISFETVSAPGQPILESNITQYDETKTSQTLFDPFIRTDLQVDPAAAQKPTSRDKVVFQREYRDEAGRTQTKYVKQTNSNQKKGETSYTASDQQALMDFFADRAGK